MQQQEMKMKGIADATAKNADERYMQVAFKNCVPFTDCISEINNTQVDNAKDLDVVIPMHNLIEYSNDYTKTSGNVWKYRQDDLNDNIKDSQSFISRQKQQVELLLVI